MYDLLCFGLCSFLTLHYTIFHLEVPFSSYGKNIGQIWKRERKNDESMDYDKLDFDPEDGDDEDALRLRALETQAKKLIPNYGSPPRPR